MVKTKEYKLISKSKYFDKKWYLASYPEVNETGLDPVMHYLRIGWKEGKNPSPDFNTNDYLERYSDVKSANINPLFHYEKYGKKEGRNLQSKEKVSFSIKSKEINCQFKIDNKTGRTIIFAMFSKNAKIPETTLYYLKELKKIANNIVLVADNPILESEINKIENLVCYCSFFRHEEYDFGSYKYGYMYAKDHGLLEQTTELILCNDSCYGPVFPFENMFNEMADKDVDFWGVCQNNEIQCHLQSYFLVFRKKVFQSQAFDNFLLNIKKEMSVNNVILKYEVPFTQHLEKYGFKWGSYIDYTFDKSIYPYNRHLNQTKFPLWLLQQKSPLIKVKVFTEQGFSFDNIVDVIKTIKKINSDLYQSIQKRQNELLEISTDCVSSNLFHRIKNKLETLCFDYNIYKIKPRFSIIMPTYNRAFCICDAIDSLLNQTYQNFELIIIDDGSTDGTQELLQQRYKKELENAKIHYIFQENTGVCKARNMGLHHAKNEWIAYLDSDNILAKDYLKTFAIAINKYMKNNLFYAKLICQSNKYIVGQKFNRKRLLSRNYIDLGVFVHHKDLYEKLGGFDENMTRLVDWELIIRYTETESPIFVDRVVLLYNDFDGHDRISNSKNYDENLKYLKAKHNI